MKKRLYKVKQSVWGAYESIILYFETKADADEYVKSHEHCNRDGCVVRGEEECNKLISETFCYIGA